MTADFDRLPREVGHDTANQVRVTGLTAGAKAIGKSRRIRRRRYWAGAALLAIAVAATISIPALVSRAGRGGSVPPPPATSPTAQAPDGPFGRPNEPIVLPGGYVVTGLQRTEEEAPALATVWALDRTRGRYVWLPYDYVWPVPRGPFVAVGSSEGPGIGIVDLRDGQRRWYEDGRSEPQWSPDGARLLLTTGSGDTAGSLTFTIINTQSGAVRKHTVDGELYPCTEVCNFTWMPNGHEVVLPQADTTVAHDEAQIDPQRGLQLFDAETGQATRQLPVRGEVWGSSAWSPDGRYVVVHGVTATSPRHYQSQLVEVSTGTVVRPFPAFCAHWIDNDQLLMAYDHITLVDIEGTEQAWTAPIVAKRGDRVFVGPR